MALAEIFMKIFLTIISIFFVQIYFGQKKILFQENEYSIFIDYSKDSKFKKRRTKFTFDKYDRQTYRYSLENIKRNKINLNKIDVQDLPKKWIDLFQYKGEFYTYYYCDFCSIYQLEFRKNMLLETRCEGPNIIAVNSFKKENSNTFSFEKTDEFGLKQEVIIHIIDEEKGIAIFETKINNESSYQLMLDVTKIEKFPIIVNDCSHSKHSEFKEFEEPDYQKLLNQK